MRIAEKLYLSGVLAAGLAALGFVVFVTPVWDTVPHTPGATLQALDYNLISCADIRYRYNGWYLLSEGMSDANHAQVTANDVARARYERKLLEDHWNAKGCQPYGKPS